MTDPMISIALACVLRDAPLTAADGIVSYLDRVETGHAREQGERDAVMERHRNRSVEEIMREVARHNCLTVMSEQVREFRGRFAEDVWIIDIGGGTGWYWRCTRGANVLLADFSRETLRVAARLLQPEDRVLMVHRDASRLPVRAGALSGVWSVQVFQHFPESVLEGVLRELRRVLRPDFGAKVFIPEPCSARARGLPVDGATLSLSKRMERTAAEQPHGRRMAGKANVLAGNRGRPPHLRALFRTVFSAAAPAPAAEVSVEGGAGAGPRLSTGAVDRAAGFHRGGARIGVRQ